MEQVLFVLAIVSFALAVVAAVVAVVVFVRGDVPNAIRFLRHKPTKGRKKATRKVAKARIAKGASGALPTGGQAASFAPLNANTPTDEIDGPTTNIDGATGVVVPQPESDTARFEDIYADTELPTDILTAEGSEQPTGLLEVEESEQPTGLLDIEESEQATGLLDASDAEESERPTGILDFEDSEYPTGILGEEESERPTGFLVEDSERPTGLLDADASEQPTGLLEVDDSEQPTGILTAGGPADESGVSGVVQHEEPGFRFMLRVDEVVVHTEEVIA